MVPMTPLITEVLTLARALARVAGPRALPKLAALDLTMAQLKLLILLAGIGQATVSELASRLQVSAPTASHLVDKLVHAGLAQRTEDPHDRRRTIVTLTREGEELHHQLRDWAHGEQFRLWLEQLTAEELEALATGLRALVRVAGVDVSQIACAQQAMVTPVVDPIAQASA